MRLSVKSSTIKGDDKIYYFDFESFEFMTVLDVVIPYTSFDSRITRWLQLLLTEDRLFYIRSLAWKRLFTISLITRKQNIIIQVELQYSYEWNNDKDLFCFPDDNISNFLSNTTHSHHGTFCVDTKMFWPHWSNRGTARSSASLCCRKRHWSAQRCAFRAAPVCHFMLSMLEAAGRTRVRKKSCSMTSRCWTRWLRVDISLGEIASPYSRGTVSQLINQLIRSIYNGKSRGCYRTIADA